MMKYVVVYLIIINIAAFCMYGMDKSAAIKQKRRIPNKVLLGMAVIGGSIGALTGMHIFRHKTQKWYYKYTVPVVLIIQIALAMLLLSGCGSGASYNQISQDEAVQMMQEQTDYLIVDVRRPDEYAEGHIPGAINVPNETIEDEQPDALPDKEQVLLIYCRSGNRSKEASQKLADMGYTNVYEFGGINTWEGEIVGAATHSETREPMMVYRPLYDDGGMYVRPLEMFLSEVDHEKYPDVKQVYRFEKAQSENLKNALERCGAAGEKVLNGETEGELYRQELLKLLEIMKVISDEDIKAAGYPANIENTIRMDQYLISGTLTEEADKLSLLSTLATYVACNSEGRPGHSAEYMDRVTELRKALESCYGAEAMRFCGRDGCWERSDGG